MNREERVEYWYNFREEVGDSWEELQKELLGPVGIDFDWIVEVYEEGKTETEIWEAVKEKIDLKNREVRIELTESYKADGNWDLEPVEE